MRDSGGFIISIFIIATLVCLLGIFLSEKADRLETENEFLKAENHMLKNALADLGAEIEEMSTQIERLMKEETRAEDWNKDARH